MLECKDDPSRLPRKTDFGDIITQDHPIALYDFSLHTVDVKSKALEVCDVNKHTENPSGGEIERDGNGIQLMLSESLKLKGLL